MKVTFHRSGGFAPMPISCKIDTAQCPPEEASQLQLLVDQSRIMQLESAEIRGARDVRYYAIEIEQDSQSKRIKFDELSVPDSVRPLIAFLQERAKSCFPDED